MSLTQLTNPKLYKFDESVSVDDDYDDDGWYNDDDGDDDRWWCGDYDRWW